MEPIFYGALPNGGSAFRYELTGGGLQLSVSDYGARVVDLKVPDRNGKLESVVLGYAGLSDYLADPMFFGATIGRIAGRMCPTTFELGGQRYTLPANDGPNHLHGGAAGFDKRLWLFDSTVSADNRVLLRYRSPEGEEGYPGNLEVSVEYAIADEGELRISYRAVTDRTTPFSPTNHTYFNLSGKPGTTINDHQLRIVADYYTPFDENFSLKGVVLPVDGSSADLRQFQTLGEAIPRQVESHGENYMLPMSDRLRSAAFVEHPESGRQMELLTTAACLQFFGGEQIPAGLVDRSGRPIPPRGGFCLESQEYPDGVNHPEICDIILKPGEEYRQTTIWRFSTF